MIFQLQYYSGNKCIYAYKHETTIAASECPANLFAQSSTVLVKNSTIFKSQVDYANRNYEKLHSTVERLLCNTEVVPPQPVLQVLQEIKCDIGEGTIDPSEESTQQPEIEQVRHKLTLEKI